MQERFDLGDGYIEDSTRVVLADHEIDEEVKRVETNPNQLSFFILDKFVQKD
jgi:hypothetical protein